MAAHHLLPCSSSACCSTSASRHAAQHRHCAPPARVDKRAVAAALRLAQHQHQATLSIAARRHRVVPRAAVIQNGDAAADVDAALPRVDPARLTATIFRLATSEQEPNQQLLHFFYAAAGAVMEHFSGLQVAQICWSLAVIGITFPPVDDLPPDEAEAAPPEEWAAAMLARLEAVVDSIPPLEAVATLWALGNLRAQPRAEVVDALLRRLQPHLEDLGDDALARIMLALTRLHHPFSEEFAAEMVVATVGRMGQLTGHQVGAIGYAFARRGFRPAEPWLVAYVQKGILVEGYCTDSFADVAFSLAVFQVSPPEEWVDLMYAATLDAQHSPMQLMSPCGLTDLLWASAVLGLKHPPVQWYLDYMAYFGAKLDHLAAPDLVRWLWAIARLDWRIPGDTYAMHLLVRATVMLAHGGFTPTDLAYVVRACNAIFLGQEGPEIDRGGEKPAWLEAFYGEVWAALDSQPGWAEDFQRLRWDTPPGLPLDHVVCRKK